MQIPLLTGLLFLFVFFGNTFRLIAQENFEVRRVNFSGNKTLDKNYLLDKLVLNEVSWIEKVATKKEPFLFSEELLQLDLKRLTRIYQSEGFLHVKASLQPLKANKKKETVKLTIEIDEGKPIITDTVSIQINNGEKSLNADSLITKLSGKLNLVKGIRFRDQAIKSDLQTIEDALKSRGFAYATATYNLDLKPDELAAGIYYSVSPGPKSFIGETSVTGNNHVSEEFIRKQLKYTKGDLYSKALLNETRQNLYRLRLFRVVSVLPVKNIQSQKNQVPVNIYIEEAPRLTTRFGAGYGTEDKFRTFADLTYSGLLGGASRFNLYLKHSALEPYSARLRWIQPQLLGTPASISVNPFIERKSEPGFDTRTYGVSVPVTYPFSDWLTGKLTTYFEDVEQRVEEGDREFSGMETDKFLYNKSGVLLSTVFNNSTPAFSPATGLNLSAGFKLNGYIFGSDFNYSKLWGDFRAYQKIGNTVLALRVMAGGIHSPDSNNFVPVEDRFYAGGSNSIRGWNRSELGPKRESGTPLGGKSILESNVEIRQHLFWRMSIVAFFEAGNVWEKSYSYNLGNLSYAAGPGFRVETPVGPVRFDMGFPLWNEKTSPQFFISVGQAF